MAAQDQVASPISVCSDLAPRWLPPRETCSRYQKHHRNRFCRCIVITPLLRLTLFKVNVKTQRAVAHSSTSPRTNERVHRMASWSHVPATSLPRFGAALSILSASTDLRWKRFCGIFAQPRTRVGSRRRGNKIATGLVCRCEECAPRQSCGPMLRPLPALARLQRHSTYVNRTIENLVGYPRLRSGTFWLRLLSARGQ